MEGGSERMDYTERGPLDFSWTRGPGEVFGERGDSDKWVKGVLVRGEYRAEGLEEKR